MAAPPGNGNAAGVSYTSGHGNPIAQAAREAAGEASMVQNSILRSTVGREKCEGDNRRHDAEQSVARVLPEHDAAVVAATSSVSVVAAPPRRQLLQKRLEELDSSSSHATAASARSKAVDAGSSTINSGHSRDYTKGQNGCAANANGTAINGSKNSEE